MATHIGAMQPITYRVERTCPRGYCHEHTYACTCWPVPDVEACVDELTASELSYYEHEGTDAQRNEVRAYLDEERDVDGVAVAMAA